jgi:acyl-coenzyme A thioesterase PaaI-like protein
MIETARRSDAEIEAMIAALAAAPPNNLCRIRLEEWSLGRVAFNCTADPPGQGLTGYLHNGMLAVLMEMAAYVAALSVLPADRVSVTVDFHLQSLRAIAGGADFRLQAEVVRPGRQLCFCRAEASIGDRLHGQATILKAVIAA